MKKKLSYTEYLARRGYKTPQQKGDFVWRFFFLSFAQPPFGGFWRLWNPVFGYYLGRLYQRLGGDRNRLIACVATFATCGFGHDLFNWIVRGRDSFSLTLTFAFIMFGVFVAATSPLPIQRFMRKLPWYVNVVINIAFLILGCVIAHSAWKYVERTLLS